MGGILGWVGSFLSGNTRVLFATILSVILLVIACLILASFDIPIPQFDKETPRDWVEGSSFYWAIKNGFSLGIGISSRLGFWLWYAIPLSAILFGKPIIGLIIYGLYGAARGFVIWVVLLGFFDSDQMTWLVEYHQTSKKLLNWSLLVVSISAVLLIGL